MQTPNNRLQELDALRGVAVLLVLIYHYSTRFGELFPRFASGVDFELGAYGVHLFFVISGFVIVMTLDRSKSAADFLVARFSRLYPAYWVAILITTAALWSFHGPVEAPGAREVAANFSMVQGFFKIPHVDGVYWTLQVELLFYVAALAVFSVGLLRRIDLVSLAWLALSVLFFSPLTAPYASRLPLANAAAMFLNLEFAPFFVIGIAFYRVYMRYGRASWNYAIAATALAVVAATMSFPVTLLIAAGCGVLVLLCGGGWRVMRFPPLVFLGTISYSLYLLHQKIGYAFMLGLQERGWSSAASILAAATLSIALATLLTFLIERPALRAIRERYKAWKKRGPGQVRPTGTLRSIFRLRYNSN